jgi:hypothetical protein
VRLDRLKYAQDALVHLLSRMKQQRMTHLNCLKRRAELPISKTNGQN